MKCKRVQDMIKTDYIDGELDALLKSRIDEHLRICPECRRLEETLREGTIDPLKKAELMQPSEAVWDNIRAAIEEERTRTFPAISISALRDLFIFRKPKLAIVTAFLLAVVITFFSVRYYVSQNALEGYLQEQVEFLDLLGNGNGVFDLEDIDIGIPGEEYLL